MGFLHKLWDETLAGPAPDDGLGKLRKYNSFSATRSTSFPNHQEISTPISRSITILRANSTNLRNANAFSSESSTSSSVPSSPSGSVTLGSPLSLSPSTPGPGVKKLARRKSTAEAIQCEESRSPTGYDWIVLSALDR